MVYQGCFKSLIVFFVLVWASVSQASGENQSAVSQLPPSDSDRALLQHIVMIWFKPEITESQIEQVVAATRTLQSIPGVVSVSAGRAIASDRPMVDDSFDVGVTMVFDNAADMKAYVSHEAHKAFLKTYIAGKTRRVVIYDYQ
jgi:hypothetical protein